MILTICQAIGCERPAVHVVERKTDRAQRVLCDEEACVVAILAAHGISNMSDIRHASAALVV